MKKTIRKFNIKRYDKNMQKYLDSRREFNISTREEKNVHIQSIFEKNKSYPTQNLRNIAKTSKRKRKITSTKNTYIRCSKKHSPTSKEKNKVRPENKNNTSEICLHTT